LKSEGLILCPWQRQHATGVDHDNNGELAPTTPLFYTTAGIMSRITVFCVDEQITLLNVERMGSAGHTTPVIVLSIF
jgi:hypothetical protein